MNKPSKPTVIKLLVGLAVLLLAIVLHIGMNVTGILGRGDLRWVNTGISVSYPTDASPLFHTNAGASFTMATRDGVRIISQNGETIFNQPMILRQPLLVGSGNYVAVAEGDRGRSVHVFNASERIFFEPFDYTLHTFSINRTGFLSVILQMDEGYVVKIFHQNNRDEWLYRRTLHPVDNPGIFPVMVEVSEDGRMVVYGMLDMNNRMVSRLLFNNTYEGDAWGTDGNFAAREFEDEWLLYMRMTTENRLVAVTDAQIIVLTRVVRGVNTIINDTASIPLYNHVTAIAFDDMGRFSVALGVPVLNSPEAYAPGTVLIFDANGNRTGTFHGDRPISNLSMGHNAVIIASNRNIHAVSLTGAPLWEFIALQDVRDFIFLEDNNTVLMAGATRADVWRRQRVRDGEAGDFFGIQGQ